MLKYVVLTLCLAGSAFALPESCAGFAAQAGFEFEPFLGDYFVSYYAAPIEIPGNLRCLQLGFEATDSNDTYRFLLSAGGAPVPLNINVPNPDDAGRWLVSSPLLPSAIDMIILATDYNTGMYMTCAEQDGTAIVGEISIFGRDAQVSDEVFQAYNSLLSDYDIIQQDWKPINQTNC